MLPLAEDWQNYAATEVSAAQLTDRKSALIATGPVSLWYHALDIRMGSIRRRFGDAQKAGHSGLLFWASVRLEQN